MGVIDSTRAFSYQHGVPICLPGNRASSGN
jgi:hypothetical protein